MGSGYPTQIYVSPLESLRKELGWSQQQAADHIKNDELNLKCDLKTFRSWEKGYTYPDAEHLKRLSVVFDVSTDYLMGLSKERHNGNKQFMKMTGLSEKSIEMLRFFHSYPVPDVDKVDHEKTIEFINIALERVYDEVQMYKQALMEEQEEEERFISGLPVIEVKNIAEMEQLYPPSPYSSEHQATIGAVSASVTTIFSRMMQYIGTESITLSFRDNGVRKTLSGVGALLEFDGDTVGDTVDSLGRTFLINRIKSMLDKMRSDRRINNGKH